MLPVRPGRKGEDSCRSCIDNKVMPVTPPTALGVAELPDSSQNDGSR